MGVSITALPAVPLEAETSPSSETVARPPESASTTNIDTIKLTVAQQVYDLYLQGQKVSQIASGLNLTVEMVNNYLGLSSDS